MSRILSMQLCFVLQNVGLQFTLFLKLFLFEYIVSLNLEMNRNRMSLMYLSWLRLLISFCTQKTGKNLEIFFVQLGMLVQNLFGSSQWTHSAGGRKSCKLNWISVICFDPICASMVLHFLFNTESESLVSLQKRFLFVHLCFVLSPSSGSVL